MTTEAAENAWKSFNESTPRTSEYRSALASLRTARKTRYPSLQDWEFLPTEISLGRVLGEGPSTTVHACQFLGGPAAVKVFKCHPPHYSPITHFPVICQKDFENAVRRGELDLWLTLDHPHVLPFIGCCLTSSTPMILTPFMSHDSARSYRAFYPEADWLRILRQIASGVEYLHTKAKMLHGDLRGTNILIDHTGSPQISDYGLATMAENPCGRPDLSSAAQWMAPELLSGKGRMTFASDIYALGMTIYEFWFDKNPFDLMEQDLVEEMVSEAHAQPTRERLPEMSDEIWLLLESC